MHISLIFFYSVLLIVHLRNSNRQSAKIAILYMLIIESILALLFALVIAGMDVPYCFVAAIYLFYSISFPILLWKIFKYDSEEQIRNGHYLQSKEFFIFIFIFTFLHFYIFLYFLFFFYFFF